MNLMSIVRAAAVSAAMVAMIYPAGAQDITPSHMKAARDAVAAIKATEMYDNILPQAAFALKQQLIQQNPDMQEQISKTVDEKVLAMVNRRADLEREAATAYARVLSEEDLKNIAIFYTSPSGKKLLEDGPIVTREVIKAADIWQRGVARDLAQAVGEELRDLDTSTPEAGTDAPAQPAQN